MQKHDEGRIRVRKRKYPMLDPLAKIISKDFDGLGPLTPTDVLLKRLLNKAVKEDPKALAECLRRACRHEIAKIDRQEFWADEVHEQTNLDYRWIGDVAVLLGIAKPFVPPEGTRLGEYEVPERFELSEWVIELAQSRGCGERAIELVRDWQKRGSPQSRRRRNVRWTEA